MNIIGIIPARYQSTRFPGKPLVEIKGKPMVIHVYEAALASKLDDVIIATDDDRILECAKKYGAKAVKTLATHINGTERCNEVLQFLADKPDAVMNIQGDEPFIKPQQLNALADLMAQEEVEIGTMVKAINSLEDINDQNVVKAALNSTGRAIYFSRSPVPFDRTGNTQYYKHLGLYAYKSSVLEKIVDLQEDVLEKAESLEQLRWLANGYNIYTVETEFDSIAVDTPEDLEKIETTYG